MISGENRRTFLGALILAGGSAAAFAESYRDTDGGGQPAGGDALFAHILAQLAAVMQTARARAVPLGAEDAATAAACLRVCATHARGLHLDDLARDGLARRLRSTSRDALITAAPDLTVVRRRLRRTGVTIGEGIVLDLTRADRGARAAALDAIAAGRATMICDGLAEALEMAAPRLAQQQGPVQRVAMADEWWCNFFVAQWSMYLAMAWSLAAIEGLSMQEFVDTCWAGFEFYNQLYSAQC